MVEIITRVSSVASTMPVRQGRTKDGEGVDVHFGRHAALAEQLWRHVRHRPKALRADVRRVHVQHPTQPEVRQPG